MQTRRGNGVMASCVLNLAYSNKVRSQLHASKNFSVHPLGFGLRGIGSRSGLCAELQVVPPAGNRFQIEHCPAGRQVSNYWQMRTEESRIFLFTAILLHVPCLFDCFCYNQQIQNYISQLYLLYIIYTPTCFDIFMSSSGSFTSVLHTFLKLKLLKLRFHKIIKIH